MDADHHLYCAEALHVVLAMLKKNCATVLLHHSFHADDDGDADRSSAAVLTAATRTRLRSEGGTPITSPPQSPPTSNPASPPPERTDGSGRGGVGSSGVPNAAVSAALKTAASEAANMESQNTLVKFVMHLFRTCFEFQELWRKGDYVEGLVEVLFPRTHIVNYHTIGRTASSRRPPLPGHASVVASASSGLTVGNAESLDVASGGRPVIDYSHLPEAPPVAGEAEPSDSATGGDGAGADGVAHDAAAVPADKVGFNRSAPVILIDAHNPSQQPPSEVSTPPRNSGGASTRELLKDFYGLSRNNTTALSPADDRYLSGRPRTGSSDSAAASDDPFDGSYAGTDDEAEATDGNHPTRSHLPTPPPRSPSFLGDDHEPGNSTGTPPPISRSVSSPQDLSAAAADAADGDNASHSESDTRAQPRRSRRGRRTNRVESIQDQEIAVVRLFQHPTSALIFELIRHIVVSSFRLDSKGMAVLEAVLEAVPPRISIQHETFFQVPLLLAVAVIN